MIQHFRLTSSKGHSYDSYALEPVPKDAFNKHGVLDPIKYPKPPKTKPLNNLPLIAYEIYLDNPIQVEEKLHVRRKRLTDTYGKKETHLILTFISRTALQQLLKDVSDTSVLFSSQIGTNL